MLPECIDLSRRGLPQKASEVRVARVVGLQRSRSDQRGIATEVREAQDAGQRFPGKVLREWAGIGVEVLKRTAFDDNEFESLRQCRSLDRRCLPEEGLESAVTHAFGKERPEGNVIPKKLQDLSNSQGSGG